MAFTDPFIRRPVLASVVSLLIVLLGFQAWSKLPIRQYPQMENALITVTTAYPGANAETIQGYITQPMQQSLASAEGIDYMTSVSRQNFSVISIYARIGADSDRLFTELLAKANEVKNKLPQDAEDPVLSKEAADASALMYISFYSSELSNPQITDYLSRVIQPKLATLPGMAEAEILGNQLFAMRLWIDPVKLAGYGLSANEVTDAVRRYNFLSAAGEVKGEYIVTSINATTELKSAEAFANIPLKTSGDSRVLLGDVARVEMGAENYDTVSSFDGTPSVYIGIKATPGANPLDVIKEVRKLLPDLRSQLPPNLKASIAYDATLFIQASIDEVVKTLVEAVLIVIVVVFLFLGALRSVLIPVITIPLSMIGVLFFMQLMGYSLNLLTLLAMVLAIGLVVDDAIVVVENIHRHLEAGDDSRTAALKGAGEIGFTVVSISFSLIAAFIPLLFMGGVVGRLFKEFALTATATILISVVVSLTLAPTLAALCMRRPEAQHDGFGQRLVRWYEKGLDRALAHQRVTLGVFGLTLALAVVGYVAIPKGFFPLQDTGFILGTSEAAADVSYPAMIEKHKALAKIIEADPAVRAFSHSVGVTGSNQTIANGRFWISLKPRGERDVSASEWIDRMRPKLAQVPGIVLYLRAGQDINLSSGPSRTQYQYVLKSNDGVALNLWTQRLTERLRENPAFRDLSNDLQLGASVTRIDIDRQAAARFGLTTTDVDQALYDAFGQRQISEFQTETNQYKVILELDARQRGKAESLNYFYLRSPLSGEMVPLSALAHVAPPSTGPLSISHDGLFPAANLSFNLAPGVALGDAVQILERTQRELGMPDSIAGNFQGAAQAFQSSLSSQPYLILAALVAVYIILGVLYESFVHPLTIISTLPSAGLGAIILLWASGQDFSIMGLIGVVLLIGIVKKNGILLIDFALEAQRHHGMTPEQAIRQACLVRFRPIIMTTLAALLGAVPLMFGFGTGAELRQPLGIAVVGGLLVSQALTLFTTPVIYLALERLFHRRQAAPAAAPSAS